MILKKTKDAEMKQMLSNLKKQINDLKNNNIITLKNFYYLIFNKLYIK